MAVKVRAATLKDLPLLKRHRRGMFQDMGRGTKAQLDAHDKAYVPWARKRLRDGSLFGFIAMLDGDVAGSGCIWLREKQPSVDYPGGRVPYLLSMFTEHEKRGRGVATAVVKAALAWAKRRSSWPFRVVSVLRSSMIRSAFVAGSARATGNVHAATRAKPWR